MGSTALETALDYARRGWAVFPLRPKSKRPPAKFAWRERSTTDPDKVRHWAEKLPGCNWGVDCGKSGLAIVDVDVKHQGAMEAALNLQLVHDCAPVFWVKTPSGGQHWYFLGHVKNSVQKLGPGLDTRGEGGYVVIPGSTVDEDGVTGGYSLVSDAPPRAIPDSIAALVGAPSEPAATPASGDVDLAHNVAAFVSFIQGHGPVMEGERNRETYLVAAQGRDCGLTMEMVSQLMASSWLPLLEGDFPLGELRRTVASVYKTAKNAPGCDTPEALFPDDLDDEAAPEKKEEDLIWSAGSIVLADIPPRDWIIGRRAISGFVDVLVAPGGMSKSTLLILECMSIVTGRELTGETVHRRGPCWLLNGEDPKEELQRRVLAAAIHHGVPVEDLADFWLSSGYGKDFSLLAATPKGLSINRRLVDSIIARAIERKVVRIVLDPLVRFHRADEKDNGAMDLFMRLTAEIADKTGAAVSIAHHTRKKKAGGDDGNGDADTARGASSLVSASRIALTLAGLGPKDAKKLGVSDAKRGWFVRLDDAKGSMVPPAEGAKWYKRVSVELENGDSVGSLETTEMDFVEEIDEEADEALGKVIHDIIVSTGATWSTYQLAKEIFDNPGRYSDFDAGGSERALRRRIASFVGEGFSVNGVSFHVSFCKGKTGRPTAMVRAESQES